MNGFKAERRPILIVALDGRKVTLEMTYATNKEASDRYDELVEAARRGTFQIDMTVKPHA